MATEPTKKSTQPIVTPKEATIASKEDTQSAPSPFVFNRELLQKRIESIKSFQMTYKGKPGFNPYIWIVANVTPLENRLNGIGPVGEKIKPEETQELHDKIMQLPLQHAPAIPKLRE